MNGAFRHPLRVGIRVAWLGFELIWIAINYVSRVSLRTNSSLLEARMRWLQWACRRVLRIFNLKITASGPIPRAGLLVSNHLGYLDILILSSLTPSVFVAKQEVRGWPVFGWFAMMAGTLFVDRQRRAGVVTSAEAVKAFLNEAALVVLFPEGTSSDGRDVLPFKSALLQPVAIPSHLLSASAIAYSLRDGDVREEVCYWKDMTLVPHLLNLLSKEGITARVQFAEVEPGGSDRKVLARRLRAEVMKLKGCVSEQLFHPALACAGPA